MADTRDDRWDRLVLRMPKGLKQEVDGLAEEYCNSLNGQIVHLIKRGILAEKAASAPTA